MRSELVIFRIVMLATPWGLLSFQMKKKNKFVASNCFYKVMQLDYITVAVLVRR